MPQIAGSFGRGQQKAGGGQALTDLITFMGQMKLQQERFEEQKRHNLALEASNETRSDALNELYSLRAEVLEKELGKPSVSPEAYKNVVTDFITNNPKHPSAPHFQSMIDQGLYEDAFVEVNQLESPKFSPTTRAPKGPTAGEVSYARKRRDRYLGEIDDAQERIDAIGEQPPTPGGFGKGKEQTALDNWNKAQKDRDKAQRSLDSLRTASEKKGIDLEFGAPTPEEAADMSDEDLLKAISGIK